MTDARIAVAARGLLAAFNTAGVLDAADVHVARRLGRLAGETDDRVLLAIALAVRAVRSGSVCVVLDDAREAATVALGDAGGDDTQPEGAAVADLPWPEPATWRAAIEASRLVAVCPDGPADRPVRWVAGRLYLDRYWRDEQLVRREIDARLDTPAFPVDPAALAAAVRRHFPDVPRPASLPGTGDTVDNSRQRLAAAAVALGRLTVLTGGPGTGKTTTIARVLAVLQEVTPATGDERLDVALAAPTGKAAARLQEAVHDVVGQMDPEDRARVGTPTATTLHRLLGWRPGTSTRFRHDAANHLPHDVVVVDETSMVSLPLMARLLEALRPGTRLLLVGDPDQLASVEAGAVLGDLVGRAPVADGLPDRLRAALPDDVPTADAPTDASDLAALRNGVVRLTQTHRYGGALGELAEAIRRDDADAVMAVLRRGDEAVDWVDAAVPLTPAQAAGVRDDVARTGAALAEAAAAGDAAGALRALEEHRLLLAHRRGDAGVAEWALQAAAWVAERIGATGGHGVDPHDPWPLGLPLIVTANDRETGLYNGDTGVVIAARGTQSGGADGSATRVVAFGEPTDPRLVHPHRLPAVQPVHAMTIHRGQGSQFRRVSVVLPPEQSPLLTRELLYTGVTRAREHVRLVGTEAAIRAAVARPIRRASGLREPF